MLALTPEPNTCSRARLVKKSTHKPTLETSVSRLPLIEFHKGCMPPRVFRCGRVTKNHTNGDGSEKQCPPSMTDAPHHSLKKITKITQLGRESRTHWYNPPHRRPGEAYRGMRGAYLVWLPVRVRAGCGECGYEGGRFVPPPRNSKRRVFKPYGSVETDDVRAFVLSYGIDSPVIGGHACTDSAQDYREQVNFPCRQRLLRRSTHLALAGWTARRLFLHQPRRERRRSAI